MFRQVMDQTVWFSILWPTFAQITRDLSRITGMIMNTTEKKPGTASGTASAATGPKAPGKKSRK